MVSAETMAVIQRAEALYEQRLKAELEKSHHGWFVAIEPESGEYFLARSIYEAGQAARSKYPNRIPFTLRIGYPVAVEIGNSPS